MGPTISVSAPRYFLEKTNPRYFVENSSKQIERISPSACLRLWLRRCKRVRSICSSSPTTRPTAVERPKPTSTSKRLEINKPSAKWSSNQKHAITSTWTISDYKTLFWPNTWSRTPQKSSIFSQDKSSQSSTSNLVPRVLNPKTRRPSTLPWPRNRYIYPPHIQNLPSFSLDRVQHWHHW